MKSQTDARAYDTPTPSGDDALSPFTIGVYLLEKGSTRAALKYLDKAWKNSGHDPVVGIKLAEGYFRSGQVNRCEGVVDELLGHEEPTTNSFILKAKLHYLKRERAEAAAILEKIAAEKPAIFEIQHLLGKIYYELGKYDQALKAYGSAVTLDPNYPYMHYRYGMLLSGFDRRAEAAAAFKRALSLNPAFSEPALELSEIWIAENRYAQADSLLSAVLAREPDNDRALLTLAEMYLDQGSYDAGIRALEERKRESSLPREGAILLGRFYYEAREYEEAIAVFLPLFESEKRKSPELARIMGEINLKAGNPEKALEFYHRAIELDPGDYKSYLSLFFAASPKYADPDVGPLSLGEKEVAELVTKAAAAVKDDDFEGCYLTGISYQSLDSLEAARGMLIKALRQKQRDESVLLALANIEEKSKRYGEAEQYLQLLYEMKPEDPTINNFYGYLLAEQGERLDKAEIMIKKALEDEPDNGYYLDSLGWVYYQRGDYHQAVLQLEKASNLVKNDPIILEHLGDAYRALQRYGEALTAYKKSKELPGSNEHIIEKIESMQKGID